MPDTSSGSPTYKAIGISLAIASGLFIGVSFVLKKVGLLKANVKYNEEAGEGYGYLRNVFWWTGMTLMIVGEVCNFVAYAFVDAILVTPMGALSVVVTTILSAVFLKERLSFVGKVGCFSCILGSVVIALNAPQQSSVSDIQEMKGYVISPGFLSYAGVIIVGCVFTAVWAGPRYGKRNMFVYITVCSLIGGLSVVATQGLGSAIIAQINGKEQFKEWFLYVLLVFVVITLLTEIIYLNKALNIFNAALVTPTYYVLFTSSTIITSAVLFQGFAASGKSIANVVMGFLQICSGVVLLQLSKSAKDVPDAAVFKGDLDQIREVATQEEAETEPKADSIRGAAAIVRQLSTKRQSQEEEEARRVVRDREQDRLQPVGENEVVEWDGLRRRKSTKTPSAKSEQLPPLGMSRFPDDDHDYDHHHDKVMEENHGPSLLEGIRSRASSLLHPSHWLPIHEHHHHHNEKGDMDTAYHGPEIHPATHRSETPGSIAWADEAPFPRTHETSPSKRQFSFNNILNRLKSPTSPIPRPRLHPEKQALKTATEEERLGLVLGGDSHKPEDDELNERLARSDSTASSSTDSSLGDGQALMDRLHRSLDAAQLDYYPRQVSGSSVSSSSTAAAAPVPVPVPGMDVRPLSSQLSSSREQSVRPPSYTPLPEERSVVTGGDSHFRVELRPSEVGGRGWRRQEY